MHELISTWLSEPFRALGPIGRVVLIVIVAWGLRKLTRLVHLQVDKRSALPAQLTAAAQRLTSTLITAAAVLLVLQQLGVSAHLLWTAATGFLAVAAVALFAVWSVLSNICCALLILITRPFRVGDHIEVLENGEQPGLSGQVAEINLIYSTLREGERGDTTSVLQIPNALFFQRIVRRRSARPAAGAIAKREQSAG